MKNRQIRRSDNHDDTAIAQILKTAVAGLCERMNEADAQGIELNFNIQRAQDGKYTVAVCSVTKRL